MRKASLSAFAMRVVVAAALGDALACGARSQPPSATPASAPAKVGTTSADAATEPSSSASPLATPSAEASACSSDAMCLNHRCNLAFGKCAFPCETDADCVRGTRCFKAVISSCQAPRFGAGSGK